MGRIREVGRDVRFGIEQGVPVNVVLKNHVETLIEDVAFLRRSDRGVRNVLRRLNPQITGHQKATARDYAISESVYELCACNSNPSPEKLTKFATSKYKEVRQTLAGSKYATPEILETLKDDTDSGVRQIANKVLLGRTLKALPTSQQYKLAKDPNTTVEVLDALSYHTSDMNLVKLISRHPNTSEETRSSCEGIIELNKARRGS